MTKTGERPITLPHHKSRDYPPGLTAAIEYTARIHHEDGTYWAEVPELAGVFASGDTLDELLEGLQEAVGRYLGDDEHAPAEISELKLAVPA